MFSRSRLILAFVVVVAAAGAVLALRLPRLGRVVPEPAGSALSNDVLPSLAGASGWLHGDRGTVDSLAGHPVVLALWSDTDPRAFEALPRVQSWHDAYARYGVRVVGVYAPEFSFGVDSSVPARFCDRFGIGFPVALDPSYQVRSRLGRLGAGGVALIDTAGRVALVTDLERLDTVDRGIRDALRRLRPDLGFPEEPAAATDEPPRRALRTVPLGTGRVNAGPLANVVPGRSTLFTSQFRYQEEGKEYVPYPVGRWIPNAEGVTADRGGAADFLAVRVGGERMSAVLSPAAGGAGASRLWVLADDGWLGSAERGADVHGDVRGGSYVDVGEPRLYEILRPGKTRVLRLSPEAPGLTIHELVFEKVATEER